VLADSEDPLVQSGVAKTKMMRRYAFRLFGLLLLSPAMLTSQNSQPDFNAFFAKFKAAVAQKDTATLTTLMMPGFSFIRAQNVSPADVFKGLDADGGLQWTNLQQAVQGQPSPYQPQGSNALAMHAHRPHIQLFRDFSAGR
jgi:hypothetical protein